MFQRMNQMNTSSTSASSWGKVLRKATIFICEMGWINIQSLNCFPLFRLGLLVSEDLGGISTFLASSLCTNNSSKTQKQGSPWDASILPALPLQTFLVFSLFSNFASNLLHHLCSRFFFFPGSFSRGSWLKWQRETESEQLKKKTEEGRRIQAAKSWEVGS